jgi:hypothetical protein
MNFSLLIILIWCFFFAEFSRFSLFTFQQLNPFLFHIPTTLASTTCWKICCKTILPWMAHTFRQQISGNRSRPLRSSPTIFVMFSLVLQAQSELEQERSAFTQSSILYHELEDILFEHSLNTSSNSSSQVCCRTCSLPSFACFSICFFAYRCWMRFSQLYYSIKPAKL